MADYLIQGLACQGRVRMLLCNTTQLVEEARKRHDSYPTASAALGRTLSAGVLMGAMLKGEEKITITINGGGPVGTVMVDANAQGEVRGFLADPKVHMTYNDTGKLAVGVAVGKEGTLSVVKDIGMKESFTGQVNLVSGEIAEDFAYYYAISEQTPTVVSLGVLVDTDNSILSSGGFMIQMMPDATEEDILKVENTIKDFPHISTLLQEQLSLETIALKLLDDFEVLQTKPLTYKCNCSMEKIENSIALLGEKEVSAMINEDHGAHAHCQFCGLNYDVTEAQLRNVLERITSQ